MPHSSPDCIDYIIDFDSTLVAAESLDGFGELVLAEHPEQESICAELQVLTELGMTGRLPFDASLSARLAMFQAHRDHITEFNDQLADQLSPSAVARSDWFENKREHIYVVSGGFEEFIQPTVARLGIMATHVYANRFVFDADGNIVGYDPARLTAHPGGKAAQVRELGLSRPIIAIGDGSTDLEIRLKGEADAFWAFTETVTRASVVTQADRVLASFMELE
jgi:D-3-phosphoglycerate dehydrogenase